MMIVQQQQQVAATRMGRRKQHCPQRTGLNEHQGLKENEGEGAAETRPNEGSETATETEENEFRADKEEDSQINEEGNNDNHLPMTSLEALEPDTLKTDRTTPTRSAPLAGSGSSPGPTTSTAAPTSPATATSAAGGNPAEGALMAAMLKNSAALLNPALFNPSLYAVQLAQLQAAQLLSQAAANSASPTKGGDEATSALTSGRKRKVDNENKKSEEEPLEKLSAVLNLSKKAELFSRADSPLDLSGAPPGVMGMKAGDLDAAAKLLPSAAWPAAATPFPFLHPLLLGQQPTSSATTAATQGSFSAAMAAAAAASAAGRFSQPNTSMAMEPRNPLERMSEIAKSGPPSSVAGRGGGGGGGGGHPRQSAWQSQWLTRGSESTKDIFKCVWCKDSFSTLQALTTHMKETKHFGSALAASPPAGLAAGQQPAPHAPPAAAAAARPAKSPRQAATSSPVSSSSSSLSSSTPPQSKPVRDILKEQLPMPRKLVRGQDVWLGRGEQQTKDILKCMWCGESFRSLDLMTKHMQETKHYTKVISQEQLISWKSSSAPNATPVSDPVPVAAGSPAGPPGPVGLPGSGGQLTEHMMKLGQFPKEEPTPTPVSNPTPSRSSRSGGSKEKRKKSLPVRKLLELERAHQEMSGGGRQGHSNSMEESSASILNSGKISCEKCSERIPMHLFVDHIRVCVGPALALLAAQQPHLTPSRPAQLDESADLESALGSKGPKSILGSLEKMVQSNFQASNRRRLVQQQVEHLGSLQRMCFENLMASESVDRPLSEMGVSTATSTSSTLRPSSRSSSTNNNGNLLSPPPQKSESSSPDHSATRSSQIEEETNEETNEETKEGKKAKSPHSMSASSPTSSACSTPAAAAAKTETAAESESVVSPGRTQSVDSNGSTGSHPLEALQMLCDKAEKTPKSGGGGGGGGGGGNAATAALGLTGSNGGAFGGPSDPGAMLAFSWACNQAVVNDSLLKCPFCDTPFISKGAYRHHLSKMHFVKDGILNDPSKLATKSNEANGEAKGDENSRSPNNSNGGPGPGPGPGPNNSEENAQSKFQKYSQLAKQLSCNKNDDQV